MYLDDEPDIQARAQKLQHHVESIVVESPVKKVVESIVKNIENCLQDTKKSNDQCGRDHASPKCD